MYQRFCNYTILLLLMIYNSCICQQIPLLKKRSSINLQANPCITPIQANNTAIGAGNCNNDQYFIFMGFGSPQLQGYYMLFDTGSPTLWISGASYTPYGFNTAYSQSFVSLRQNGTVQYADNSQVSGFYGRDYISIPPYINVTGQILVATQQSNMNLQGQIYGIVGMDYASTNFLDLAYQTKQIQTSTFTLQLAPTSGNSFIYYNQIPDSILSKTLYSNVISGSQFWALNLIGFFANDNDYTSLAAGTAVIDSGTSLFYLNPQLYSQVQQTYLQSCKNQSFYFLCKCGIPLPTFKFMFPGVQVQLDPASYSSTIAGGYCQVFINTLATESNQVLLGDTLFMNYAITFNKVSGTVGFAGQKVTSIFVVGSNSSFVAGQYAMMSFTLIFVLYAIAILFATREKSVRELQIQLNKQVDIYKAETTNPQNGIQQNSINNQNRYL